MLRSCDLSDFCEKILCGNNLAVEDKSCDIFNEKLEQNIVNVDTAMENVDKLHRNMKKLLTHGQMSVQNGMRYT